MRYWRGASMSMVVVLALLGCTPAPEPTTRPLLKVTTSDLPHDSSLTLTGSNITAQLTIRQGDVLKARSKIEYGALSLDKTTSDRPSCIVDPSRGDAIVPFQILLKNTTNTPVAFDVQWDITPKTGNSSSIPVKLAQFYLKESSQDCVEEATPSFAQIQSGSLKSGDSVVTEGVIILNGYFSPLFPLGNAGAAKNYVLQVRQVTGGETNLRVSSLPTGGFTRDDKLDYYYLPVAPSLNK